MTAGHDRKKVDYFAWVAAKFALCMHNAKPNIIKNKIVLMAIYLLKSISRHVSDFILPFTPKPKEKPRQSKAYYYKK